MRNWNFVTSTWRTLSAGGFYLTYEELKLLCKVHWSQYRQEDFILPMRNWNLGHDFHQIRPNAGFYLTYEELKPPSTVWKSFPVRWILSYLWGIETSSAKVLSRFVSWFYLTYEELKRWWLSPCSAWPFQDFILPMRNWNTEAIAAVSSSEARFYLTYEELKQSNRVRRHTNQSRILSYLWGIETCYDMADRCNADGILSYLWGIETQSCKGHGTFQLQGFYLTYEELKLNGVKVLENTPFDFILPMRNWNIISAVISPSADMDFILPMRNWNFSFWSLSISACKPDFILPMRNWNNISTFWLVTTIKDFILPMRNWNAINSSPMSSPMLILSYLWGIETMKALQDTTLNHQILSYLWGIETIIWYIRESNQRRILSYLWGIETIFCIVELIFIFPILSYLWGIETYNL